MYHSLTDVLPPEALGDPDLLEARVAQAYILLFEGRGSREDADIVLADLAIQSGYFDTVDPEASDRALRQREGKRELMQRVMEAVNRPFDELRQLHAAVQKTPVLDRDTTEG